MNNLMNSAVNRTMQFIMLCSRLLPTSFILPIQHPIQYAVQRGIQLYVYPVSSLVDRMLTIYLVTSILNDPMICLVEFTWPFSGPFRM